MSREALLAAKNFIESLRVPQDKIQAALQIGQGARVLETIDSALDAEATGTAVLVNGEVVAWFKDFYGADDDRIASYYQSCQDWCRDNYFGQWLTQKAYAPEVVPFTKEQLAAAEAEAEELSKFFNLWD